MVTLLNLKLPGLPFNVWFTTDNMQENETQRGHHLGINLRISQMTWPKAKVTLQDKLCGSSGSFNASTDLAPNFCPQGNYVLDRDELVEAQTPEYDVVLCLSLTKWVHLNWGDEGLKRMFRRIYRHLRPGGILVLEPQPWSSYGKRKTLTVSWGFQWKLGISFL